MLYIYNDCSVMSGKTAGTRIGVRSRKVRLFAYASDGWVCVLCRILVDRGEYVVGLTVVVMVSGISITE